MILGMPNLDSIGDAGTVETYGRRRASARRVGTSPYGAFYSRDRAELYGRRKKKKKNKWARTIGNILKPIADSYKDEIGDYVGGPVGDLIEGSIGNWANASSSRAPQQIPTTLQDAPDFGPADPTSPAATATSSWFSENKTLVLAGGGILAALLFLRK